MNTRATTWAAWIVAVLVLLASGTASASSVLLSPNSCQGKIALEGRFHQRSSAVSAESCRGYSQACSCDAAGLFVAPTGIGRFPEWRVGGSITQAMPDGSYPSWQTIRSRYWQNRAAAVAPTEFGPQNLGAMRAGNPPSARVVVRNNATGQEQTIRVVKELHHARGGRGTPGFDTPVDLREVWPWEHAAIDPSRRLDYTFIRFATGN
jgi:hypothetical protein